MMKVVRSVLLLIAIFATTLAYPATEKVSPPNETPVTKSNERVPPVEHEIDFVPLEEQRPGAPFPPNGVIDVDANAGGFLGNPFDNNPFPSLFESFNALMYRMRQQLNQLLGQVPEQSGDSPFPELHIPNVGNIDLGKGNTTSVTKVIDGHKVTINETEYKQEGENGGSYFKVRVIDVHPDSAEATGKPVDAPNKQVESVEYADISNEIPKVKDNEAFKSTDIETFDEVDAAGSTHHAAHIRSNRHWGHTKPLETFEDNSINSELVPPPDLSNDIYVNQLLLDSGAPPNPDAEVFEVSNGQLPPPRKTAALNYLPPQRGDFNTNEPASDFSRVGIHPTYTHNMPFMPRPMFPVNYAMPNMPPSNVYIRPPNFPMFQSHLPTNQMYFPQHVSSFSSPENFEHAPLSDPSAARLGGTTQINEKDTATSNVPVSTETGANNPSTTS